MTKEYNRGIEAAANMIDVARKLNGNPDSSAYRSLTHAHVMVLGMMEEVATKKQVSKYQPIIIACAPDFVPREATPREELEYYLSKNVQVKLNRGKYTLETTVTLLGERFIK